MRTIFIPPNCAPQWLDVPGEGQAFYYNERALVGGLIDIGSLGEIPGTNVNAYVVFNDEGLLFNLPPNLRTETGVLLGGNLLVVGERWNEKDRDTETCDLPESAMEFVRNWLASGKRCVAVSYDIPPATIVSGDEADAILRGEKPMPERPPVRVSADYHEIRESHT